MKCFYCSGCGMMIFFENDQCVKCGRRLGFLPDTLILSALEPQPGNKWLPHSQSQPKTQRVYRSCSNEQQAHVCNWMIPAENADPFCLACSLNDVIPDLTVGGNLGRWHKLELAKKRCLYSLLQLGLPITGDDSHPHLRFRFLSDQNSGQPVPTGHDGGVITVNIAEADDDERERRRITFHEPYRTLVGHLRHELGHYYWDRLVAGSPQIDRFRQIFGDETVDYGSALQTYYQNGPAVDWSERCVSAYASAHPWEDWAETWAHYLHIRDTMETAASFGLRLNPPGPAPLKIAPALEKLSDFDHLMAQWLPMTCALNSINRGMGLSDLYPFVIPPRAIEKLRLVHDVTTAQGQPRH